MKRRPILAIDGPAGTGKTTSARLVARRLGFAYIDSGALYRAIALAAYRAGIESAEDDSIIPLLARLPVRAALTHRAFRVTIGAEDVTDRLREPEVSQLASKLAVRPDVRDRVVEWLRELASMGPAVIEGRDIGTAVFPKAELKIFLTASVAVRARRRALELAERGIEISEEQVARELVERDERDSRRAIAPLQRAPDAFEVDTSAIDVEGQVARILEAWGARIRPKRRPFYRLEQWLVRTSVRLIHGLEVRGSESVPRAGGVILVANHKSYLDPPLVGSLLPRETAYLAKRELFSNPVARLWLKNSNAIPIDRAGFDREAIDRSMNVLREGCALLVFPEGTRIRRPGFGEPKEGIAMLAARAEVPIVPVHIRGSWPEERRRLRRPKVRIRFGRPFLLEKVPAGRAGRSRFPGIAREIMDRIAQVERESPLESETRTP